jgi:hypothetical protein
LVGITAAPAGVSAATNQMVFTPYSLPSNNGFFIGGAGIPNFGTGTGATGTTTTFTGNSSNPTVTAVTASADGNSIYAWDDAAKILYYSSNAGKSFTALAFNTAAPVAGQSYTQFTGTFVDLEVSPKFATDGTVVLATGGLGTSQVWMISGGLANAVNITGDLSTKLEGGSITSMDVGSYYTNGVLAVYIGVSGGTTNIYSNVLVFQQGGFSWASVGNLVGGGITVGITNAGAFYNSAGVASITISNGGAYTVAPTGVTFTPAAGTTQTGFIAPVVASITMAGTAVTGVVLTSGGYGYLAAPAVAFTGGTFTAAATGTANMTTIAAPVITFTGGTNVGGVPAAATANVNATTGAISSITVTAGSAYTVAPTIAISNSPGHVVVANDATLSIALTTNVNVLAVKLSPNYQSDAEVMAVYTDGTNTFLDSNIAALGWNNSILPRCTLVNATSTPVIAPFVATSAVIEAGTDYFANSTGTVLVGVGAATPAAGAALYIVKGRVAAPGTVTNILNQAVLVPNGLAVQGPTATASVVVASPGTTALNITTAVTASTVSWVGSAAYRGATGTAITGLWYCGTNNAKLLAGSTGFVVVAGTPAYNSGDGGAINVSADNGNTFNQIGLISVETTTGAAGLAGLNPSIDIVSDTNWFSNLSNNGG